MRFPCDPQPVNAWHGHRPERRPGRTGGMFPLGRLAAPHILINVPLCVPSPQAFHDDRRLRRLMDTVDPHVQILKVLPKRRLQGGHQFR